MSTDTFKSQITQLFHMQFSSKGATKTTTGLFLYLDCGCVSQTCLLFSEHEHKTSSICNV